MTKRRPSGDGMVRKRSDGRWEGRIVIGHKENGRPIFRYLSAKTQKDLLEKLRAEKEKYLGVEISEQSKMLLRDWLDRWLNEYIMPSVRESTLNGYRGYIERYIKPYLGEKPVGKITADDVRKFYQAVQHNDSAKPLSVSSIRRIHGVLHQAMNAAVQEHLIALNPTEGIILPQRQTTAMRVLNDEQLNIFMAVIEQDEVWHDFFYTELTTGLRLGEICGLKWCDFDEVKGTLKIARTLHYKKVGEYTTGETKTGNGKRTITLPPSTADILRKRQTTALSEWIFPNPTKPELPIAPQSAYNRLKVLLNKAGLPDIRFHDLRHTFATHAMASGVNAKTLSGILGHSKASFTLDRYTHVTGDMQKRAAEIVGSFMSEIMVKE